jgi:Glycosyl transferase family 21
VIALVLVLHTAIAAGFALFAAGVAWRAKPAPRLVSTPPLFLLLPAETPRASALEPTLYSGDLLTQACTAPASGEAVNRKVEHLEAGIANCGARTVIAWADADVELAPGDLDALVATLLDEAPDGIAIAPPAPSGWLASVIFTQSPHAFALLARLAAIAGARPRVAGKLVAIRASTLSALGGFARIAPFIADDLALIDAVGGRVALSARPVTTRARPGFFAQLVRWLRVARAHDPALLLAYPTVIAPLAVTLALAIACALSGTPRLGMAAIAIQLAARTTLAVVLRTRLYPPAARSLLLAPLGAIAGDLLVTAALTRALRSPICWGAYLYVLSAGGRIATRRSRRRVMAASHSAPVPRAPPW